MKSNSTSVYITCIAQLAAAFSACHWITQNSCVKFLSSSEIDIPAILNIPRVQPIPKFPIRCWNYIYIYGSNWFVLETRQLFYNDEPFIKLAHVNCLLLVRFNCN